MFPATLGIEHRIVNGRVYLAANPVTGPAEISRRLEIFQRRAGYYDEHWDRLYGAADPSSTRTQGLAASRASWEASPGSSRT